MSVVNIHRVCKWSEQDGRLVVVVYLSSGCGSQLLEVIKLVKVINKGMFWILRAQQHETTGQHLFLALFFCPSGVLNTRLLKANSAACLSSYRKTMQQYFLSQLVGMKYVLIDMEVKHIVIYILGYYSKHDHLFVARSWKDFVLS